MGRLPDAAEGVTSFLEKRPPRSGTGLDPICRTSSPTGARHRASVRSSRASTTMSEFGPLAGTRIIELAGIGPSQHGEMLLADLGADVIRVHRRTASRSPRPGATSSIAVGGRFCLI